MNLNRPNSIASSMTINPMLKFSDSSENSSQQVIADFKLRKSELEKQTTNMNQLQSIA